MPEQITPQKIADRRQPVRRQAPDRGSGHADRKEALCVLKDADDRFLPRGTAADYVYSGDFDLEFYREERRTMKKMTKKKKLFRTATVLAAVIALGASLAGCGSSGEETTQRYSSGEETTAAGAGNGEPGGYGNTDFRREVCGRDFGAERWKDENSGLRKLNARRRPRSARNVCRW